MTVTGAEKHPLYAALIAAQPKAVQRARCRLREKLKGYGIETLPEPELLWNFEKFLVSREWGSGEAVRSGYAADAPELVTAIESELMKS